MGQFYFRLLLLPGVQECPLLLLMAVMGPTARSSATLSCVTTQLHQCPCCLPTMLLSPGRMAESLCLASACHLPSAAAPGTSQAKHVLPCSALTLPWCWGTHGGSGEVPSPGLPRSACSWIRATTKARPIRRVSKSCQSGYPQIPGGRGGHIPLPFLFSC